MRSDRALPLTQPGHSSVKAPPDSDFLGRLCNSVGPSGRSAKRGFAAGQTSTVIPAADSGFPNADLDISAARSQTGILEMSPE